MIALALSMALQAPAPVGAVVEARPKVLVLDFRDDGVGPNVVRIIHDTLVSHVSKDHRVDVISSEDVRQAVAREAERRELNDCSDESCLAEIAEALGAQLTLYGTAGRLGELVIVNVNLYDARAARSVGRETIEVGALEQLPDPLRLAGDRLVAKLGLGGRIETTRAFSPGPIFWTGAGLGVAGLLGAGIGATVWLVNRDAYRSAVNETFEAKQAAKQTEDLGFGGMLLGAGALAVGGAVIGAATFVE
ncbi:MAG: hypothetical protein IT382_15485 [Deltaproteobacteria bacterium]|nr:hypothetical protein [Deltaproteobacteria bacterium]